MIECSFGRFAPEISDFSKPQTPSSTDLIRHISSEILLGMGFAGRVVSERAHKFEAV